MAYLSVSFRGSSYKAWQLNVPLLVPIRGLKAKKSFIPFSYCVFLHKCYDKFYVTKLKSYLINFKLKMLLISVNILM